MTRYESLSILILRLAIVATTGVTCPILSSSLSGLSGLFGILSVFQFRENSGCAFHTRLFLHTTLVLYRLHEMVNRPIRSYLSRACRHSEVVTPVRQFSSLRNTDDNSNKQVKDLLIVTYYSTTLASIDFSRCILPSARREPMKAILVQITISTSATVCRQHERCSQIRSDK